MRKLIAGINMTLDGYCDHTAVDPDEEIHEVVELKKQSGGDILVGSRSLIIQLMKLNLVDEYQFCVHPVIAGGGLPLFEKMNERTLLKLVKTKTFRSGAITLYYEPFKNL